MKLRAVYAALAALCLGSTAHGADFTVTTRVQRVQETARPIARLADQGIGYSVLHDTGSPQRPYRVHVTCTITETFVQTYCPTPQYVATCPTAAIACR